MAMTPQEQQARQSRLRIGRRPLFDETDWPPLKGGWRVGHASVVVLSILLPIRPTTT